jgi:DNA modification methylase
VGKINTAYVFFTTTKFGYELIKSNEKWFRYDLVWNKQKGAGFLNARKMPMRSHEMIYVFYNKLPIYNITDHHVHTPPRVKQAPYVGGIYGDGGGTLVQACGSQWNPRLPVSILDFQTPKNRAKQFHQTEKPLEVLQWIIKYYSKEGNTVLDPTIGSGSTAVACKLLKRSCIGFEMDVTIFNVAKKRLEIE